MSQVQLDPDYLTKLQALDAAVRALNTQKIRLIFDAVGITTTDADFEKLMDWILILVCVPDKQMAVQLNKLCAYIPNLKFVDDGTKPIFTLMQGNKSRRVWKAR